MSPERPSREAQKNFLLGSVYHASLLLAIVSAAFAVQGDWQYAMPALVAAVAAFVIGRRRRTVTQMKQEGLIPVENPPALRTALTALIGVVGLTAILAVREGHAWTLLLTAGLWVVFFLYALRRQTP